MKLKHILLALAMGIMVSVLMYAAGSYLPEAVSDIFNFPGLAAGSILFGHSFAMVVTALAVNAVFYSLLTLGILCLFVRRISN